MLLGCPDRNEADLGRLSERNELGPGPFRPSTYAGSNALVSRVTGHDANAKDCRFRACFDTISRVRYRNSYKR